MLISTWAQTLVANPLGVEAFVGKKQWVPNPNLQIWTNKEMSENVRSLKQKTHIYNWRRCHSLWHWISGRLWIIYSIRAIFKPWHSMKSWLVHGDPYNRSIIIPIYIYIYLDLVVHQITANNEGFCSLLICFQAYQQPYNNHLRNPSATTATGWWCWCFNSESWRMMDTW